jgi:hypothetical protein
LNVEVLKSLEERPKDFRSSPRLVPMVGFVFDIFQVFSERCDRKREGTVVLQRAVVDFAGDSEGVELRDVDKLMKTFIGLDMAIGVK